VRDSDYPPQFSCSIGKYNLGLVMPKAVFCVALLAVAAQGAQQSGTVKGRVLGTPGRVKIARAEVQLGGYRGVSDTEGSFAFAGVKPGEYQLQASGNGYKPVTSTIHVGGGETKEVEITLVRDELRTFQSVSVQAAPDPSGPGRNGEFTLSRADIQNLGTVIADDPLRAVQAVPGVTSNNDFEARFSLRGADFSRIGVYLDGILLHDPVHSLEGADLSGSAGIFNMNAVRQIKLYDDAYSETFADSSAAVVDVSMRDGRSDGYHVRFSGNIAEAGVALEGPLSARCSWIGAFRKTYIQDLISQVLTDPSMAFGLQDGQGRLSCEVTRSNILTVDLIDGNTDLNRSSIRNQLGANELMLASQRAQIANLGWIFAPNERFQVANHFAWMTDWFAAKDPFSSPLGRGSYGEWSGVSNLTWITNSHEELQAGFVGRARRADGFTQELDRAQELEIVDNYAGADVLTGGYISESVTGWKGRVRLSASGRWDHDSLNGVTVFSPQAGLTLGLTHSLQFSLGWGQYAQMPDITQLGSELGGARLLPMRSTHVNAGAQYRLGASTVLRAEVYSRLDRDLLYQPYYDPRMVDGMVVMPPARPLFYNSLGGRARGAEVYVQRAMGRRVTGWVSYAYGRTWMHDSVSGYSFPSDWDQRNTVNAYASYRLRPTVNLSSRFTYGSGFPVPGFLTTINGEFYLATQRDTLRLPPYERLDFRVNKVWKHEKWTTTLFAEVLNAMNRTNVRFGSLDSYNGTGRAWVSMDQMFPILPSVGIVLER
jgi:Carboxypeptidase regulatory-like domain/TonB-dependent Receptor Plug Domain